MFERAVQLLYPCQCLMCGTLVDSEAALCGTCWLDTPFITGTTCDSCGLPLPDDGMEAGDVDLEPMCDGCLSMERAWSKGRAALLYENNAKRLVLAIKNDDRLDLVAPVAAWLSDAVRPILTEDTVITCVPAHWRRLLQRRFNQACMLSSSVARLTGLPHFPDLLTRPTATPELEGMGRAERQEVLDGAIRIHRRWAGAVDGKTVLLIDDVMTTGATLNACARACRDAGARDVRVGALARVAPWG